MPSVASQNAIHSSSIWILQRLILIVGFVVEAVGWDDGCGGGVVVVAEREGEAFAQKLAGEFGLSAEAMDDPFGGWSMAADGCD